MKFFFNQIKHHLLFIVALAIIVNPLYSMHNGFLNENNNLNENNAQQLFDDNQMQVLNQIYNEIQERLAQNQPIVNQEIIDQVQNANIFNDVQIQQIIEDINNIVEQQVDQLQQQQDNQLGNIILKQEHLEILQEQVNDNYFWTKVWIVVGGIVVAVTTTATMLFILSRLQTKNQEAFDAYSKNQGNHDDKPDKPYNPA